ncbi:fibronectin type III and SPRY domain-containing protein 2 isoform X2 [Ascaphus truei]|uniref:fibronectin type III and SPRY domain-containing protein 2 isoform X2 n=1 Tax=Ascaphus truei TaxID=8439 RepID=UPI003F59C2D1
MEPETFEEIVVYHSPDHLNPTIDEAEEQYESEEANEPEPEGLTFYHMDLYDLKERLDIFPEGYTSLEFGDAVEGNESAASNEILVHSPEQIQLDLEREVDELAKLYGISENSDKDIEELQLKTFQYVKHTTPTLIAPYKNLTFAIPEQNKESDPAGNICQRIDEEPSIGKEDDYGHSDHKGGQLDCDDGHLGDKDGHLGDKDGHLGDKDRHLGDKDRHLGDKDGHLGDKDGHLGDRDEHPEDKEEHLEDKEEHVEDKDGHLGDKEEHLEDKDGHLEDKDGHLGDKEEHLEDIEEHLEDKDGNLEDIEEHLEDKDGDLEDIEEHLEDKDGNLEDIEEHLEDKDGNPEDIEEHLEDIEEHLEDIEEHLEDIEEHLEDIEEHLEDKDEHREHNDESPHCEEHTADIQEDSNADADKAEEDNNNSYIYFMDQTNKEKEVPDIFCVTCKIPIRAFEKLFGMHKEHNVTQIATAVEDIKEEIHKNMCKLEEQIAQMENFASHLEDIFITVEENVARQEQSFEMQYTEVMDLLTVKHEEKVQALGDEKKLKLETLYDQLIDCGKSLDTSKDLMETIQKLFKGKDKVEFVKMVLNTTNRLNDYFNTDTNLNISTSGEYQNTSIDFCEVEQLLGSMNTIPAPSAPVINPQTPSSATAISLRICWSLFSDDTVESYQLYYRPVCDGTPGEEQEEFMIRAKETYCTVTNLMPNTQYEFWVTAVNTTGGSPASESSVYVTAPSPPAIKRKECRSCENAALICWESGNINPVDSYTVEIYKVTNDARDNVVTESVEGIPNCESLIQLEPGETYHITVRAVNVGGPSECSKSVTIHTTGTFFHLNEETAHPLLSISDNGFTITCDEEESFVDLPYHCKNFTRCIAVMGNLIPFKGKHYWEVEVDEDTEYRVGVAYEDTNRNGFLGANNTSWCLRHILTPSRHKYEFLHCGIAPDLRITVPPKRIGILLDYTHKKLSFFNTDLPQHLYTFTCHFRHLVHPCFALEKPGSLKIHNGVPIPPSLSVS